MDKLSQPAELCMVSVGVLKETVLEIDASLLIMEGKEEGPAVSQDLQVILDQYEDLSRFLLNYRPLDNMTT